MQCTPSLTPVSIRRETCSKKVQPCLGSVTKWLLEENLSIYTFEMCVSFPGCEPLWGPGNVGGSL